MADNNNDPAGSTQMFRAFVDEGTANPAPRAAASSSRTGLVVTVAVVVVALVAVAVWLVAK